jgi:hypothetical protein
MVSGVVSKRVSVEFESVVKRCARLRAPVDPKEAHPEGVRQRKHR